MFDWLLKTSDHFPQIIGTLASGSTVNIQVWDVINDGNTLIDITNSGCYAIGDTGRWGWSTENLPLSQNQSSQYFYLMTSDVDAEFGGEFIINVPENAKWIFPNNNEDYLKSI